MGAVATFLGLILAAAVGTIVRQTFFRWGPAVALSLARLADRLEGTGDEYQLAVHEAWADNADDHGLGLAIHILPFAALRGPQLAALRLSARIASLPKRERLPGELSKTVIFALLILPSAVGLTILYGRPVFILLTLWLPAASIVDLVIAQRQADSSGR